MKSQITLLILALSMTLISCKKDIYGCMDNAAANYSNLATKDDGSCFYFEPAATSTIVTISNWTQNGNNWVTTIPYGEITSDVIDNGAVMVYLQNGTNVWNSLPLTIYESTSYSTTIEVSITVGQVIITWTNSDATLPADPGAGVYKITVIS
jgi:hypothetical protein